MSEEVTTQGQTLDLTNRVILTVNGLEHIFTYEQLSINFNNTPEEILRATQALINENITDEDDEFTFTVRKSSESQNVFIYPKPTAGEESTFIN